MTGAPFREPEGLPALVNDIERRLAAFYVFEPLAFAADHLLDDAGLSRSLPEIAAPDACAGRAGVYLLQGDQSADEMYVGIHFSDTVSAAIGAANPLRRLDDGNLDAFCVVVEEVSHFHLILNRSSEAKPVKKLELEWQGEIDKVLVASMLLAEQHGDSHLDALLWRLFDGARITSPEQHLYWEASRQAARFWRSLNLDRRRPLTQPVRDWLRHHYRSSWDSKKTAINRSSDYRRAG